MNMPARFPVALPFLIVFVCGGAALMRSGVYGWTVFVLLPLFLGGLASWTFRSTTGARAGVWAQ